jgi:hypothetical protein
MNAFWKKTAIPGYTTSFSVNIKNTFIILYNVLHSDGSMSMSCLFGVHNKHMLDLLGTTKPPNRIHMEAMREPNASMKPMKSHTRAPAISDTKSWEGFICV